MTQTVTIFKGLPGSGKTTKAKEIVATSEGKIKRINKDDLRAMLDEGKHSKERENFILVTRDTLIMNALLSGYSVIVDDTNLHEKHVAHITDLVGGRLPAVEVKLDDSFMKVPVKECILRDALRPNPVGKKVIRRMAKDFEVGQVQPYHIEGLPYAVICDLDGTLALMGKRNPFDASTCEQDELNGAVASYLHSLAMQGLAIFYFSGREDKYRDQTRSWLNKNGMNFHKELVMRKSGDSTKDAIIKEAMFEQYIRGQYNVHVVLDDRNQVVEKWRELGLTVFQVADGDF